MLKFSGYTLDKLIYEGLTTQVYKGIRNNDENRVIVKYLNLEFPSRQELSKFRQEYELLKSLNNNSIINVYDLIPYHNSYAFIMQDIGGKSVLELLQTKELTLSQKLSIAAGMAHAVQQVHQHNIIHKDVNPSNFIWNSETGTVVIIDFGIATELSHENNTVMEQSHIEGTFHYISPEQTGRINRAIDYRTDLYSLGAALYEIFTGQKPFKGDDEIELVYSHIAKRAVPPKRINSELPAVISDMVMTLLSKIMENRYQSAAGLKNDLEFCLNELKAKGTVKHFQIGQKDFSNRFQIPQKLYGRTKEITTLTENLDRVAKGGMEFSLISGYSGLGKTSLVHELQRTIASQNGYYIFGKSEKLEKDIPYKAFIQAFRNLVRQVLLKSEDQWEIYKKHLREALGPNGNIIAELVPEIEELIGPQPAVEILNPREAKNRFQLVLRDFIRAFAFENHPLVIFLDDLQWSDLSSFYVLSYILTSCEIKYLFIIGTYRKNEVDAGHPLMNLIGKVKQNIDDKLLSFNQISLEPLNETDTNQLVSDTLVCAPGKTRELSKLIYKKTEGNPFFINQILSSLYKKNVFRFNNTSGCWEWKQKEIEKEEISGNVVDFLIKRYSTLSVSTKNVLRNASCFGTRFSFKLLSYISKQSVKTIAKAIWVALENEIILPLGHNYYLIKPGNIEQLPPDTDILFCFHHDRIQQSAYSLISDEYKPQVHLQIGRVLLRHYSEEQQKKHLFDLVYHLNIGKNLIKTNKERLKLVELNYLAGQKAKKATAYATALDYFQIAETLIPSEKWVSDYATGFDISREIVEATFLSGSIKEAQEKFKQLLQAAKDRFDAGEVYSLEAYILEFAGEKRETIIENLRKGLQLFGVELPSDPDEINRKGQEAIGRWLAALERHPIEKLHELPQATDRDKIRIMNLLFQAIPAAIQSNFPLYLYIELLLFDLTVTYGTTPVSGKVIADGGVIMGSVLGNYEAAYKLGEAAFRLIERQNANSMKSSVCFIFSTFLSHWRVHYQEGLDYFDLTRKAGLETGDLQHTAYSCVHKLYRLFYIGKNLDECRQENEKEIPFLNELKAVMQLFLIKIFLHFINSLLGSFENDSEMNSAENELFEEIKESDNLFLSYMFGQLNTLFYYFMGDIHAAEKWNSFTETCHQGGAGHFSYPDYYLFQSLVLVKKWKISPEQEQEKIKLKLVENLSTLKVWSDNCPDNFAHKYYLLAAQIAIIEGKPIEKVIDLFKKVQDSIKDDDFIHLRALANEMEADYWLEKGYDKVAKTYIQEAYYLYKRWGAVYKIHCFEKKYSDYFTGFNQTKGTQKKQTSTSNLMDGRFFDVAAIIKSMQAISSEIKTEKLLKALMKIIIENAGAQHGCLLLKHDSDNRFYIEAQKRDDSNEIEVMKSFDFYESDSICKEIVQYVIRSEQSVVLDNAKNAGDYQAIQYIKKNQVVSVLCLPIIYHNTCKGIVYLENNLSEHVFTPDKLEIIKILSSQVSISIENAHLYENLEEKVIERTDQLKIANDKLKELSLRDPLTKLHNRRYLYEHIIGLSHSFIKSKKKLLTSEDQRTLSNKNKVLGIYLMDLDHFKTVNDTYGHQAGDHVLFTISHTIRNLIRDEDFILRWGGEEFLIILNNTDIAYLQKFAKKLLQTVRETQIKISGDKTINVTCSVGCSSFPLALNNPDILTLEQTINLSDWALYMAKEGGRDRAFYIELKESATGSRLKHYLSDINKNTPINDNYITVTPVL